MKMQTKLLMLLIVTLAAAVNCSRRSIVEQANPNLDPFPVKVVEGEKSADPQVAAQWNMSKVGMESIWSQPQSNSRRVIVALVGTGVDYTHEDLAGNILVNQAEWKSLTPGKQTPVDRIDDDENGYVDDFVGYDFVEDDGLPYDRNGMGTAMAGILAAQNENGKGIRGILPQVSLLPVRYIDSSGQFFLPHLIQSMEYAMIRKADIILLHTPSYAFSTEQNIDMETGETVSMGDMEKSSLTQIVTRLQKAEIPVVVSAGNTGSLIDNKNSIIEELRRYPNVVVITSVDEQDKRPFIANFSMRYVRTAAPGVKVLTTAPGNRYEEVTGTSVAAAHVTGAVALGVAQYYGKISTPKMIQAFLSPEASDPAPSLQFETMGGNRLNIQKYLSYLGQSL